MTLVFKGVDNEILDQTKGKLKHAIERIAPFAKVIYVMKTFNIVKVRFRTMAMADKVKENRLRLPWFSIPPRNIKQERYTDIPQCMPCYSYTHI